MPNEEDGPLAEWEREAIAEMLRGIEQAAAQVRLRRDFPVPVDTTINHGPVFRDQSFINERSDNMPDEEPPLICEGCGDSSKDDETVTERSDLGIRCESCNNQCDRCGTDMAELRANHAGEENVCGDCEHSCNECGESEMYTELIQIGFGWDSSYLCSDCSRTCDECGMVTSYDNMIEVEEEWFCEDHTTWCDECDERRVIGRGCPSCGGDGTSGIDGYCHTEPNTWYGGPGGRYYVGIEHEVYMDGNRNARHMREWSSANVGDDFLHCKHDGSVEGYEIATQPMTPEFFETVDWESYMDTLNQHQPIRGSGGRARNTEPTTHGIHVHIGRKAFDRDEVAIAAFCYLIAQGNHLERIARREPYHYCEKVTRPVKTAISARNKATAQFRRIMHTGDPVYAGRDAINLNNRETIEIRAFASTRSANDLRNAVRVVYLAADYVNHLRKSKIGMSRKTLVWSEFARWVGQTMPEAFASIAGLEGDNEPSNKRRITKMTW